MDVFQTIPTEILVNIFSSLSPIDLVNASYLSHRLHAIAEPLLYSAPTLYTSQDRVVDPPPSALEKFLRTLLTPRGEALATRVNSLTLLWTHTGTNDTGLYPRRLLDDMGPSPSPVALRGLAPNILVLLLLARLPSLRVLDVIPRYMPATTFDNFVAEFMNTLGTTRLFPSAFQSLREVQFVPLHYSFGFTQDTLLVLLKLPSIDSLDVWLHVTGVIGPEYGLGCTSSVTKLHLWNDGIKADELATILKIPQRLTHFSCNAPTDFAFGYAMKPLRKSLQHLSLSPPATGGEMPELGSLRGWSQLRSVRCSLANLLDDQTKPYPLHLDDMLPAGIRELLIWQVEERVTLLVKEVVALLERKEELVPGLHRLMIDLAAGREEHSIILEACMAAHVSFSSQTYFTAGCCYNEDT